MAETDDLMADLLTDPIMRALILGPERIPPPDSPSADPWASTWVDDKDDES